MRCPKKQLVEPAPIQMPAASARCEDEIVTTRFACAPERSSMRQFWPGFLTLNGVGRFAVIFTLRLRNMYIPDNGGRSRQHKHSETAS
jgi:hypothetical protein